MTQVGLDRTLIENVSFRGMSFMIVRDDLYPVVGGGNKARKMMSIAREIELRGCNAVVTTGGIQSNHCRAVAVSCASKNWKCKLILHGDRNRFFEEGGNALLMRLSGAEIEFVEAEEIGQAMDRAMAEFEQRGERPYYIYGGGHDMAGGRAYVEAVKEVSSYCLENDCVPDYIFLASGTGSTQAGILAGLDVTGLKSEVIGISVARKREKAEVIVDRFYTDLKNELGISNNNRSVNVLDAFLAGGYEKSSPELLNTIRSLAKEAGLFTDPTYTGKAFWGMLETIKSEGIAGKVMFWHTGGINNLLACNLL